MSVRPPLSSPAAPPGGRLLSLDVLRAVAVFLVLGRHLPAELDLGALGGGLGPVLEVWRRGGWVGVDLFFVLSGFLVSGLLFAEHHRHGRLRPVRFLIRRGLKIYPAFYVMIAVTVVARGGEVSLPGLLRELFFVQNLGPGLWGHTWSLAVEEHFYLALAALFPLLLARREGRPEPFAVLPRWVILGVALPGLVLRTAHGFLIDYGHVTHLFNTVLRVDALAFGVLLAWAYHARHERFMATARRWRRPLVTLGVALLVPPFIWPLGSTLFLHTVGLTLFYLGGGMILTALVAAPPRPSSGVRGLAWIGTFSYSIYLWHLPFGEAVFSAAWLEPLPIVVRLLLYLVGSVAFGIVAARLVEMPVLALRDRLVPSLSRPLVPPGGTVESSGESS